MRTRVQHGGISAPETVQEGGTITIEVQSGAKELRVFVPGRVRTKRIPVVDGVAEYTLPPTVRGGAIVIISDMKEPRSSTAEVDVVGNQ